MVDQQRSAKVLLSFGLLGALWSASGFIGAFTRASNAIYGVTEGRPFCKLRPLQIGLAAVALVLLAVVALGLIVSGPVTDAVGDLMHAGGLAADGVERGQVAGARDDHDAAAVAAVLDRARTSGSPGSAGSPRAARWRCSSWVVVSFGFGLYVANFASYDVTYGSLGAVIAFLVWLYLSNSALMLGVQINAELQRGRAHCRRGEPDPGEPPCWPAPDRRPGREPAARRLPAVPPGSAEGMERGNSKHGPRVDEQMSREVSGLVQGPGTGGSRVEECAHAGAGWRGPARSDQRARPATTGPAPRRG